MSDWKKLFRENMAADPEFAVYIKGLEPGTPVQPTVKDHVALLNLRAQALEKEAREGNELVALPDGGWLIDTPGLRSVALWDADEGVDDERAAR